jgi:hypothetical protein
LEPDWDKRYREGVHDDTTGVHDLVKRFASSISYHKPIIDIAMGQGQFLSSTFSIGRFTLNSFASPPREASCCTKHFWAGRTG